MAGSAPEVGTGQSGVFLTKGHEFVWKATSRGAGILIPTTALNVMLQVGDVGT